MKIIPYVSRCSQYACDKRKVVNLSPESFKPGQSNPGQFKIIKLILLKFLFVFSILLSACSPKPQEYVYRGETMGTSYTVKVVTFDKQTVPENMQQKIDSTLVDFNLIMSTYIKDSELSRLNRAPENAWVSVGPALYYLLDMSKQLSELTDGAFDVTVGPLVNLWGFGPDEASMTEPDEKVLAVTRERVGHHLFELDYDKSSINRKADIYIDLSAIAKGYGTDVLAGLLEKHHFNNFMIEIGGELFLKGHNAQGEWWTIGVEKPTLGHEGAVQAISVSNAGVATSGDYRNYHEINGKRYSHTINPDTGKPIEHNLASVTVIAPSGAEADALATALNVMGPEKGYNFAVKNGLAVYMLIHEGGAFTNKFTPEFEKYRVQQ